MGNVSSKDQSDEILLRDVREEDLPIFFDHQRDPVATQMAAFPARDREAFKEHWAKILDNNAVLKRTILCGNDVAGNIVCFEQDSRQLVGYWIGREFWGKGVATRALLEFIAVIEFRPIHAYVAKLNVGSIRVLEKCGFTRSGECAVPFGTEGEVIEELVFTLVN